MERIPGTWIARALGAALVVAGSACSDLEFGASHLEIAPNPAYPGDSVVFAFSLTVFPAQGFNVIVLIDGGEHTSVMRNEALDTTFVVQLGDAADLIALYGVGMHVGAIEVRLSDGSHTVGTAGRLFELQDTVPPARAARPSR